jgi:hypothetical protein
MTAMLPEPLPPERGPVPAQGPSIALVDLLDRVLAGGVVISGEITLCIDDIDLVRISLRALVASVQAAAGPQAPGSEP